MPISGVKLCLRLFRRGFAARSAKHGCRHVSDLNLVRLGLFFCLLLFLKGLLPSLNHACVDGLVVVRFFFLKKTLCCTVVILSELILENRYFLFFTLGLLASVGTLCISLVVGGNRAVD